MLSADLGRDYVTGSTSTHHIHFKIQHCTVWGRVSVIEAHFCTDQAEAKIKSNLFHLLLFFSIGGFDRSVKLIFDSVLGIMD